MIQRGFDWIEVGVFFDRASDVLREIRGFRDLLSVMQGFLGEGRQGTGTRFYRGSWRWDHGFLLHGPRMRGHADVVLCASSVSCSIPGLADFLLSSRFRVLRVDYAFDFLGKIGDSHWLDPERVCSRRSGISSRWIKEECQGDVGFDWENSGWTRYIGSDEVVLKIYNKNAERGFPDPSLRTWVRAELTLRGKVSKVQTCESSEEWEELLIGEFGRRYSWDGQISFQESSIRFFPQRRGCPSDPGRLQWISDRVRGLIRKGLEIQKRVMINSSGPGVCLDLESLVGEVEYENGSQGNSEFETDQGGPQQALLPGLPSWARSGVYRGSGEASSRLHRRRSCPDDHLSRIQ